MLTPLQLVQIPIITNRARAMIYAPLLDEAMDKWEINTTPRAAMFLANVMHESGELIHTKELWGPTEYQRNYEPPSRTATLLGNTQPGDGRRYLGRGLIQITGRANMAACSKALFDNVSILVGNPQLLEEPVFAAQSAAWFCYAHGCLDHADHDDFHGFCKRINPALLGMPHRVEYYERALKAYEGLNEPRS